MKAVLVVVLMIVHSNLRPLTAAHEQGSALLYTLVILPLAILCTIVAFDVSRYQALRGKAQQRADQIALLGAKALPDAAEAERVIRQAVRGSPELQLARDAHGGELLTVAPDRIALTLEGAVEVGFSVPFGSSSGDTYRFTVRERAEAAVAPTDLILVLADGRTLRPPPGEAWGERAAWPASKYFQFVRAPIIQGGGGIGAEEWGGWSAHWDDGAYPRWATQSCFNPAVSALKLAAVSIVDIFGVFSGNRVGILFTPSESSERGFSVLQPPTFMGRGLEGKLSLSYFEVEHFLSDELCAAIAAEESSGELRYQLPPAPDFVPVSAETCARRFDETGWGALYYPQGLLSDCARESATLREALYLHAVRADAHNADGSSMLAALQQAFLQLSLATPAQRGAIIAQRGNLAASVEKHIIYIGDALFAVTSESTAFLDDLRRQSIRLTLVAYEHEFLDASAATLLTRRTESLRDLRHPAVKLHIARSAKELTEQILPQLLNNGRRYVLRS